MKTEIKPGIYQATKGEFSGAALMVIAVTDSEQTGNLYLSIYNPENKESHELTQFDWQEMTDADGLEWVSEIPVEIQDEYLNKDSVAHLKGLE